MMNADQKQQITFMRENGTGYKEIARIMNIPLNTVQSFCRRHNLTGNRGNKSRETPVQEVSEMEFILIGNKETYTTVKQCMSRKRNGGIDGWPIFKIKISLVE